ncbi:MAG: thioredoxin domain-containing protein [Candidatus Anstonellaceae archaeon]
MAEQGGKIMSEGHKTNPDEKLGGTEAHYVVGIAIILAALLISATVYISLSSISATIGNLKLSAAPSAGAGSGQQAAAQPTQPRAAQAQPQPQQQQVANINLEGLPYQGAADAKVAVVEYSDFQCPFCQRAYPTVKQLMNEYGAKVKFYYKHFPLSFHQNAQKSAEAYECALEQGKNWEYHDKLFDNGQADGTGLNNADLKKYASDLGLDTAKFNSCLDSGKFASKVQADAAEGSANGVSGTPTFFINGQAVVGAQPYATIKSVVDAKLAAAG